jgi:hypothetical protein
MKHNFLSTIAIAIGTVALLWAAYLHFGRTSLSLEELTVERLSVDDLTVFGTLVAEDFTIVGRLTADDLNVNGRLSAARIIVERQGKEFVILSKSSFTESGALALLNPKGNQVLIATDGLLALRGGDPRIQKEMIERLRGNAILLAATLESSTIAMKGDDKYEVVIEAGKTLDDPLGIRGGRINIRASSKSFKFDASGTKAAPPREW